MAIKYAFRNVNDNLNRGENKKQGVHPLALSRKNIKSGKLADRMSSINGHGKGEALKAITDVFYAIEQELAAGNTVSIEGFGTFGLTLQFTGEKVGSDHQRAESIEVKNIVLRQHPDLKKRLNTAGFERQTEK